MSKKKTKKKIHRHLKWKPFMLLLCILGCFFGSIYYLFNLRIKNIYIEGTTYLSDTDIIVAAGIKNYPKMFRNTIYSLEKKIEQLPLVNDAKVRKNLLGKVTITIDEAKPLFYDRNTSCYVLSNGQTTANDSFLGIPFLVNQVPDYIYKRLVTELKMVDTSALQMISEIEYSPSMSGDIVIDDTRFLLRMNDGNQVYINLINIDRLNDYALIYTIFTEKGILELDSDNEFVVFKSYKSIEENKKNEENKDDEKEL